MISQFTKEVRSLSDKNFCFAVYIKIKKRNQILKDFEDGNINVLVSMKCLDEGVDIPRAELAIFCSSTGNPRQFIQRRGRVLRKHADKSIAIIHDLIVIPKINRSFKNYEIEKKILLGELRRVVNFANMSINKTDTFKELQSVLDHYSLSYYNL